MNRFIRSLAVLAFAAVTQLASASAPVAQSAAVGLELPDYIGVLEFMGERTTRGAHVARSYSYRSPGMALDIDVFDYDAAELNAGLDSAVLRDQFEQAKREARASAPRRAKLLAEDVVQFGTQAKFPAREAVYRLTTRDFEHTSYLWLASVQGRLLEMRFTVQDGFEEDGYVSRSEILATLGPTVVNVPAPREPKVNVAIVWDPKTPSAENQLWMTYLLTRAAQIAQESASQDLPLGDWQPGFDEEVRARTMAVNTFRNLKVKGPQPKSEYFSDLDQVESAGFLREYAWRYLHDASWTTAPPGLNLKAFDEWRATVIPNHVAVTYGRIRLAELK